MMAPDAPAERVVACHPPADHHSALPDATRDASTAPRHRPRPHSLPATRGPPTSTPRWSSVRVASWNARALLTPNETQFSARWNEVEKLLGKAQILCIQESHGSLVDMKLLAARRSQSHHLLMSPAPRADAGGVLIWVSKAFAPTIPGFKEYCPGRIEAAHIRTDSGDEMTVVNIHNFDVSSEHIAAIAGDAEAAAESSTAFWVFTGDWNFGEPDAPMIRTGPRGQTRAGRDGPERRRWRRLLNVVVEVTHMAVRHDTLLPLILGTTRSHNRRLTAPPWWSRPRC